MKNIERINKTFIAYCIMVIHMRKVFFLFGIVALFCIGYYFHVPHLYFINSTITVSLDDEIKPYDYIKVYYKVLKEDITVINHVDNSKCGKYKIEYCFYNKKVSIDVEVIDNIAPVFETINKKILLNEEIKAEELILDIYDQTETKVYFKEEYNFNKEGNYKVEVIVEDEYHNKSSKIAYILVEAKDQESPVLEGLTKLRVREGQKIDYMDNVIVYDDHDENPQVIIDDKYVNTNKEGEYEVIYTIRDSSGNKTVYTRKIVIVDKYANIDPKMDGIKTCYLTFDDGPSYNTPKILDILDQYRIKATFFITGTHSDSYHYIKEICDKGHVLGLHTFSHDYENIYTSIASYMKDLKKIKKLVRDKTGIDVHYIRFPGGSSNLVSKKYNVGIMKRLVKKVIDEGYQYYDWTCVNGDGEHIKTIDGLVKKAKEEIGDLEDIMFLMHDGSQNQATVESLPLILDYLIEKGYEFKVIDDYSPTFHHTVQN